MELQQPAAEVLAGQPPTETTERKRLSKRTAARLAWSLWGLFVLFAVLSLILEYLSDPSTFLSTILPNVLAVVILLTYVTVGALIASRRPANPIGWIFCAAALLVIISVFGVNYAGYALVTSPGSLPGGMMMAWFASWIRDIGFQLIISFLLLYFPDGQLPSQGWRVVAWSAAIGIALSTLLKTVKPGPMAYTYLNNPLGIEGADGLLGPLEIVVSYFLLAAIAACIASVVVRFRRAEGDERLQLKWFSYAAALATPLLLLINQFEDDIRSPFQQAVYDVVFRLTFAAVPIAAGIAILKYRLYDIDLIINRTLVYVPLTAILAGVYSATLALSQRLFQALTGQRSDAAVVLTTLILVVTFTPIKNALQTIVDKQFKENPHTVKKLEEFTEQVAGFVQMSSAEQLIRRLLDEMVQAFNTRGGAAYLVHKGQMKSTYETSGWLGKDDGVLIGLEFDSKPLGEIRLGAKKSEQEYTAKDRNTLQENADRVAEAIWLAEYARGHLMSGEWPSAVQARST
jgi:hypothetical protein